MNHNPLYFNEEKLLSHLAEFSNQEPFDHCVIDGFFTEEIARQLSLEYPGYSDPKWFFYDNPIENKKALNDWNVFPSLTYKVINQLTSHEFTEVLSRATSIPLRPDQGLHGGGWHIHAAGGNLNPHLDYSIHPKLRLQRKINIIIYLSPELRTEHGGHLGLWAHDAGNNCPGKLIKEIAPTFNRAVIFDTTQNSWHGMSRKLVQPEGTFRKSIAVYYLTEPLEQTDIRERALFAPREDQKENGAVLELIKKRSNNTLYSTAYRSE
jgi:Rps23 Pro-64 3,4-dihydroxylase Tpa1-like proline 4-hydroxylase